MKIIHNAKWVLLLALPLLATAETSDGQNSRSYDTNEWIPIDPSDQENRRSAQGRVLNIDSPNQKYHSELVRLRPQTQQFLRETSFQKNQNVRQQQKNQRPYKFETLLPPLQPQKQYQQEQLNPQFSQQRLNSQFQQQSQQNFPQQYVQQSQFLQTLPNQNLNQQLVAPVPQTSPNLYEAAQYSLPFNKSFYQDLNPGAINQELLGAIQYNQNVPKFEATTPKTKQEEKENVQLLYVPLENLKPNQPITQSSQIVYQHAESPRQDKQIANNVQFRENVQQDFISQALAAHKLQQQFQLGQPILLQTTTTTAKPKKRKAHQPPLAVFMGKQGQADVTDVLGILKDAKTISVQDHVGPDSPQVFVGPSTLDPEGYTKFPLPYLSAIESNRVERKVDQLPFFVAPLSYKTPQGYSKIPLPSPHVGSVVIKEEQVVKQQHIGPNQIGHQVEGLKQNFFTTSAPPQNNFETSTLKQQESNNYQEFQVTPTKQFVPSLQLEPQQNYQVDGRITPQNYQLSNFPQDLKVQNYQLPNYQTKFLPQLKTQLDQFQAVSDLATPKPQQSYQQSKPQINQFQTAEATPETRQRYQVQSKPQLNQFSTFEEAVGTPETQQHYQIESKPEVSKFQPEEAFVTPRTQQKFQVETTPQVDQFRGADEDFITPRTQQNQQFQEDSFVTPKSQQNYQVELKPQVDQFQPPKTQQNLFSYTEAPTFQSTTTQAAQVNQYKVSRQPEVVVNKHQDEYRPEVTTEVQYKFAQQPDVQTQNSYQNIQQPEFGPSGLPQQNRYNSGIEQYELDQINQFIAANNQELPLPSTQPPQTYDTVEISTKASRGKQRKRQRGRTTTSTTTTTTPATFKADRYTVLEEFSIKPRTTSTPGYNTEVETIPANVYKLTPEQVEPTYVQETPQIQQHVLNQEMLDQQILRGYFQQQTTELPQSSVSQDPHLSPLVYNRGQSQEERETHQENHEQTQLPGVSPYLPGLINNLQDEGVKHLLVPNLLVPTTEKLATPQPSTELIQEVYSTEAPKIETTTRRSRGRQRGSNSRYTTTSTPRRAVSRRRPTRVTTTTTERQVTRTTTDYTPTYDATRRPTSSRQRFRTRGRPAPKEYPSVNERISQTSQPVNAFKPPSLEGGFQASPGEPQSYMQFEHTINNQEVITIKTDAGNGDEIQDPKAIRDYHQVYSLPPQVSSTDGKYLGDDSSSTPVVDIQISHPVVTERAREPVIITGPPEDTQFVQVNANIQSGGVLYNHKQEVTTKPPVRVRGRTRTRGRTTTLRPTVATTLKQEDEEEEDFYGFIRAPNYNKPAPLVYTTTEAPVQIYSTPRAVVQYEEEQPSSTVRFVGEIRPKYPSTTQVAEEETEAPKPKPRMRIRIPSRKVSQSTNEVNSPRLDDQITRRSNVVRSRSRGKTHFKLPENPKQKTSDDEDVEGGNYPAPYLKKQEASTENPSFQISVDPFGEDDQVPHSSIYRPKWVEASGLPRVNDLEIQDKKMIVDSAESSETSKDDNEENVPYEEDAEETTTEMRDVTTTEEAVETTTTKRKKGGRRRGVWKLVKQKPLDQFETAESQNYQSVLNGFEEIGKSKPSSTTTESNIFNALYNMFGMSSGEASTPAPREELTTTPISPTFPEEITEQTATTLADEDEELTTLPATTEAVLKSYEVEPWDMRVVKTSTSTEVSHETEICYKGRCVKTKEEDKIRLK